MSSIESDTSNKKDILGKRTKNPQQRHMMSMRMSTQQQRMYSTSQYAQQPIHNMTRTEMPRTMPHMQSLSNIQMRKLPFYNVIDEAVKPIILVGQDSCTLPNFPSGMKEAMFKLWILPRHAQAICLDRDMSNGKAEYNTQLQIRICLLESGATEITDCMPRGLHIRVNNKACPLPPTNPKTRPGTEARRTPRPINCTQQMKLNPNVSNSIVINWNPDGKTYVLGMYLVNKLSSDILLQRLKDKGARSSEETTRKIIKMLADVDPDLATTSYRFSLVCPLGKMLMTIPTKSINCDHLQCFDASIFILMNEKNPTWLCPICNKSCSYDDLQIESYFLDIVTNPNLSDCCNAIEILADGTWKVYDETNENKNSEIVIADIKDKAIVFIDLDDSDDKPVPESKKESKPECSKDSENLKSSFIDLTLIDEDEPPKKKNKKDKPIPEFKKKSKPECSKDSENLKSSFIDLTLSDDDEPPKGKDKQDNEAQAADAIQPATTTVYLKPQVTASRYMFRARRCN